LGKTHWDIYWYGILIATGFSLALLYAFKNARRFDINLDKLLDAVLITAPVSILCARSYYLIFDGEELESFSDFFGFTTSGFAGLAIYGAIIGAFVCGTLMCKLFKLKILDVLDLTAIGFLIGQGIGRWGNFVNQEAFGTFTGSSWWGMESARTISYMGAEGLVHPCFLYESIWCLIGVFVLHKLSKNRKFSGQLFLTYGVWYGFERGFLELIRTDSLMWGRIRISSLLSFVICITCFILLLTLFKKYKSENKGEYSSLFNENQEEQEENV
jgi:phosphatidylglycerol:prolipoprotein diacylglycerol transferase